MTLPALAFSASAKESSPSFEAGKRTSKITSRAPAATNFSVNAA